MKKFGLLAFLFLLVGLLLVSACAQPAAKKETAPVPPPASKAEVATTSEAKKLYDANCAVCHGPNRQGVSGLGLPLTPESLARLSDDEIRNTILKGKPNTAMVGFEGRLSAEQINSLLQLIKYSSP